MAAASGRTRQTPDVLEVQWMARLQRLRISDKETADVLECLLPRELGRYHG